MLSPTAPAPAPASSPWAGGGGARLGLLGAKVAKADSGGGSGGLSSDTSFPELGSQPQGQGQPKLSVKKRISIHKIIPQSTSQSQTQQQASFPREFGTNSQPAVTSTGAGAEKSWRKKFSPVSPEFGNKAKTNTSNTTPVTSKSGCVAFQHETDGRSTFPNQKDFHDFCKQRDLFYGIKEIWTTQRSDPLRPQTTSTNYDPAFSKMKQLFHLNSTPTNLNRLAMLFLSQCILDSVFCGSQAGKVEGSGGNVARLNPESRKAENTVRKFLQSNPSRLELLRNRVAPNPAVSEVDFIQINDPMAFLKYFIGSSASVPTFTQFLIDQAIHELTEIEMTLDTEGPPTDPKEILDLIQKSVLLGKMLGFLYYLPYSQNANSKSNSTSVEQQALLRSYQAPPLDMYGAIIKAFKQNRLITTLPWVLELLSQADPVVQHLPKYKPCVQLISFLYLKCFCDNSGPSTPENIKYLTMVGINRQFLRLYVENLVGSYISSSDNVLSETTFSELEISLDLGARISTDIADSTEINSEHVDSQTLIGSTLIPLRFSSDQQIEKTFQRNNEDFPPLVPSGSEQAVPESPFPDRVLQNVDALKLKRDTVQDMLEAQFYKMHPASLKKTIEFVAERIASNFIKNVRNFLLPQIKQDLAARGIAKHKAVAEVKAKIKALQTEFCTDRCRKSLEYLLDESLSSGVKATSCSIAITKAEDKVTHWAGQHVTPDKFPVIEILDNVPVTATATAPTNQKTTKLTKAAKEDNHKPSSELGHDLLPFECMILLQRSLRKLHNGQLVDVAVIDQITKSLHKIYNYKPWTRNSIMNLVTALITYQPKDFNDRLQTEFTQAFKTFGWNEDEDPSKLLSARNVMLFAQSKMPDDTWKVFGSFLVALLRNELLHVKTLEEFCLVLLRQDWSPEIIERVHKLLTLLKHESGGQGFGAADELMSWTEWVYSGREDESF